MIAHGPKTLVEFVADEFANGRLPELSMASTTHYPGVFNGTNGADPEWIKAVQAAMAETGTKQYVLVHVDTHSLGNVPGPNSDVYLLVNLETWKFRAFTIASFASQLCTEYHNHDAWPTLAAIVEGIRQVHEVIK